MALLPELNTLKDSLAKHGLQNLYESLLTKGYSMDLLSECSENDVEELCGVLKLDLIDRLRFKRCLRELNIPKSSTYTIITEKEEKVIHDIDDTLKTLENVITAATTDNESDIIKQNKELINCTFDALINIINNKRKEILIELDNSYKHKQQQNEHVLNCYNELKQIKIKCESLLIPHKHRIDLNERHQTMLNMKDEWSNKYRCLNEIRSININIKDMSDIGQSITDMIEVVPQRVNIMDNMDDEIIGIGDHELVVFEYRTVRAWRHDKEQQKWRGRGKGKVSIYYNNETQQAKLIFLDEKYDKTRLLQYINGAEQAIIEHNIGDNTSEIRWKAADYTMNEMDPLMGEWKMEFEDRNTAKQFIALFNQYINRLKPVIEKKKEMFVFEDKEDDDRKEEDCPICYESPIKDALQTKCGHIFCGKCIGATLKNTSTCPMCRMPCCVEDLIEPNKEIASFVDNLDFNFGAFMKDIKGFVSSNIIDDKNEDNVKQITCEPIINLCEISVASGHENEILLKSFDVICVYRWGLDVSSERCWKSRATNTSIMFYRCKESDKTRLIARENVTNKLRLNQWILPRQIANIKKKTATQIQWQAFDATLLEEDNGKHKGFCVFAAKFVDAESADGFMNFFKDVSNCNDDDTIKLDEYNIDELMLYDDVNGWKQLAVDTLLELYQNESDGIMRLICRESIDHCIETANIHKTADNQVQWTINDMSFIAKFKDNETAEKFMSYFEANQNI